MSASHRGRGASGTRKDGHRRAGKRCCCAGEGACSLPCPVWVDQHRAWPSSVLASVQVGARGASDEDKVVTSRSEGPTAQESAATRSASRLGSVHPHSCSVCRDFAHRLTSSRPKSRSRLDAALALSSPTALPAVHEALDSAPCQPRRPVHRTRPQARKAPPQLRLCHGRRSPRLVCFLLPRPAPLRDRKAPHPRLALCRRLRHLEVRVVSLTCQPFRADSVPSRLDSAEAKVVPAQGKALISTGLAIAVPEGTYGRVAPRSGLGRSPFT